MDGDVRRGSGDGETDERERPGRASPREDERESKGEAGREPEGDEEGHEKPPMSRGRKILYWGIGLAVVAALVVAGTLYWLHARHYETTDDAFIDGNQSQVAPQVGGRVVQLLINDNQHVQAGQLLVQIDRRDYQVRLEQARAQAANAAAQAAQARADFAVQQAAVQQQQAQMLVAQADLVQAQQDLARYRNIDPAAISRQQFDQSSAATKSAAAKVEAARQVVAGAQAQVAAAQTKIGAADAAERQAQAQVADAELQLGYTDIHAPVAGQVTRRTVNVGNYVTPGQPLLAVIPDEMWVTANFRETQLTDMRVGQKVQVTVDAYPDQKLDGHIDSVQRGTGAVFSSLPAENATGNYVKIVQRVPVKIVFDGDDWRKLPLSPGLSVSPRVTVR